MLEDQELKKYYGNYTNQLLTKMENGEVWVVDGDRELNERLNTWAQEIESSIALDTLKEHDEDLLIILAFIRLRKSLRLLKELDKKIIGIPYRLLHITPSEIEKDKIPMNHRALHVYRERLIAIYKHDLITRLFDKKRCETISVIVKEIMEHHGRKL